MSDWATEPGSISGHPTAAQDVPTLFGQTMTYVAITVGFFALGAYLGRNLTYGWGWVTFLGAFACLFGMRFAVRQSASLAAGLLFVFGILMGLAVAPTLAYYASVDSPGALASGWGHRPLHDRARRSRATGVDETCPASPVPAFGDWWHSSCSASWRSSSTSRMPHSSTRSPDWSSSPDLTMFDFQRLRTKGDAASAPLIAASIFLDALNVFLFFLNIFSRSD